MKFSASGILGLLPLPAWERVGVRGLRDDRETLTLTPPLSHPNSGLPEFGAKNWRKSETSDFRWEGEHIECAAPQKHGESDSRNGENAQVYSAAARAGCACAAMR